MNATARHARRQLRDLRATNRAQRRARRAVATGTAQTMRTHLLALGVDAKLAKVYAGTVSRNVGVAADQITVTIKLKGRRTAQKPAYVYTGRQVARALAAYTAKGGPKRTTDRAPFFAAARYALAA
jgi:hypothetical protein